MSERIFLWMNKHFGPLRDDFQRVCWVIYGDSFGSLTSQSNGIGVVQEVRPLEDCEICFGSGGMLSSEQHLMLPANWFHNLWSNMAVKLAFLMDGKTAREGTNLAHVNFWPRSKSEPNPISLAWPESLVTIRKPTPEATYLPNQNSSRFIKFSFGPRSGNPRWLSDQVPGNDFWCFSLSNFEWLRPKNRTRAEQVGS